MFLYVNNKYRNNKNFQKMSILIEFGFGSVYFLWSRKTQSGNTAKTDSKEVHTEG